MKRVRLARLLDPARPLTYGIVQAGPHTPGGTPYIRPTDMTDAQGVAEPDRLLRTTPEIAREYKRAAVVPGDVVLSIGPSYGKVMVVPVSLGGANLTQGTARLAPGPGVDSRWLYWSLQSAPVRQQWEALVAGGTFRALNLGPLAQTELPWPAVPQQQQVAAFLDEQVARLDAAGSELRKLGDLVAERTRTSFVRLMLDADLAAGKVAVRRLVLDERLGAWGDEAGGRYEVAVARVADFDRLQFRVGAVPTRRSLAARQARPRLLQDGDTLLERSGGTAERPVGCVVTFLDADGTPTISSNFVSRLRPTRDCWPRYLTLVLAAMYEARWNRAWYTQTTGIQNLDSQAYLRLEVPRRDQEEQRRLADSADHLLEQRSDARQQVAQIDVLLEERKRALITACVTGEFDVSAASSRAGDAALVHLPSGHGLVAE